MSVVGHFFDQSPSEMSDDEIRIGLVEIAKRRDELVKLADLMNGLAEQVAEERDRRVVLRRLEEDALSPVHILGPARIHD